MKYRRLSIQELELLTEDFVKFLASNTITASDWVIIKEQKLAQAQELMDVFSDIVMEKVYNKIDCLENRSKDTLLLFKFEGDLMQIIGVQASDASVDFIDLSSQSFDLSRLKLTGFRSTKVLAAGQKPVEVHQLIESGSFMCTSTRFATIDLQIP